MDQPAVQQCPSHTIHALTLKPKKRITGHYTVFKTADRSFPIANAVVAGSERGLRTNEDDTEIQEQTYCTPLITLQFVAMNVLSNEGIIHRYVGESDTTLCS
jgi:hypothetical protein